MNISDIETISSSSYSSGSEHSHYEYARTGQLSPEEAAFLERVNRLSEELKSKNKFITEVLQKCEKTRSEMKDVIEQSKKTIKEWEMGVKQLDQAVVDKLYEVIEFEREQEEQREYLECIKLRFQC